MGGIVTLSVWLLPILTLVAARAGSEPATVAATPQIAVQGSAEVRVAPDRAIARFGVQIEAPEAQTAQARVNEVMQRALQALRRLGIPQSRIGTERLDLSPVYEQTGLPGRERPRLTGYRAANQVRVELDDMTRLAPVIDAAVGAGANTVEGIQFAVANEGPQRLEALSRASEEARAKAQAIARALGVELGSLIEASEGGVDVSPPRPMAFDRAALAATPIEPGEATVRATVVLRYAIRSEKKEP